MNGPTCIFWANLTPFSLKGKGEGKGAGPAAAEARAEALLEGAMLAGLKVRKTPGWPRSWANFSLS